MFRSLFILIVAVACVNSCPASPVTDSFSGAGRLYSPGDFGPANSPNYMMTVQVIGAVSMFSYDIRISATSGTIDGLNNSGVHLGALGFGDTGGISDSLQTTPTAETFQVTIENYTATATNGGTVVNDTVLVQFESFDLVNNGNSAASINWTDNQGGGGTTANTIGGSGVTTTENSITAEATELSLVANNAFMWVNDIMTSHTGSITVSVTAVPEPSAGLLWIGAIAFAGARRRKACVPNK